MIRNNTQIMQNTDYLKIIGVFFAFNVIFTLRFDCITVNFYYEIL